MIEVKRRKKSLTPEEVDHMLIDYNHGVPLKEITVKYGISRATVYNLINQYIKEHSNE